MNKKQRHTPEQIKQYSKSFIEFMKAPKEKPDGEENETTDNELETSPTGDKPEEKL